MIDKESLYQYLLLIGDNSMVLGHRLSELCGHGPSLETDIALTNISLDLFGEVRNLFQYAAELKDGETTEDTVAHARHAHAFRNCLLVEQPNTDFAHVIIRQFLFDSYHKLLLDSLTISSDTRLREIAIKSLKEATYHLRFSSEWVLRLALGTEESQGRIQVALTTLYPYVYELTNPVAIEEYAVNEGIGADMNILREKYMASISAHLAKTELLTPAHKASFANGKKGIHSEHLDYILSEFQFMQRSYPNLQW